jgi:capsular polysaccharide biosynthesis protein
MTTTHEKGRTHVELRTYGKILWRRIWIIALVVGIVAIYVGYQYSAAHKPTDSNTTYQSTVDIRIGLQAPHTNSPTFTDYLTTSEALADELVTGPTLISTTFGTQVIQQIQNDMPTILDKYRDPNLGNWHNAAAITSALSASRTHSVVHIAIIWPTEAGAWAIAHAVGEVTTTHISEYLNYQINNAPANSADYPIAAARVTNLSESSSTVTATSETKTSLLLALLIVGLILGIALAFLIEYLDDRIQESSEVVRMLQLPIYGELPRAPRSGHSDHKH